MVFIKNLAIIIVLLFSIKAIQASQAEKLYWVKLEVKNQKQIDRIANHIHIDRKIENNIYSIVNEHDYKILKNKFSKLIIESHLYKKNPYHITNQEYEFPKGDEKFHTYSEILEEFKKYKKQFPNLVEIKSIGKSLEGREIPMLRITPKENRKTKRFVPGIAFLGTHHAREHLSTEIPVHLIRYILQNYSKSQELRNLVNSRDIYFIPMVNPDGAMFDIKGKKYKSWRKNRRNNDGSSFGVDLNRNYSYLWGTGGSSKSPGSDVYMGPTPFSEPESIAVRDFIQERSNIRILLSFHTFSELILYPWAAKKGSVGGRDQKVFEKMATTMAKWNGYEPKPASGLYIASGETCDWAYGTHKIFCFTFELSPKSFWGGGFYPGAKIIEKTFMANLKPAMYLIKHAGAPYDVID